MPEQDDHQLLADFARSGSETAFSELVRRYIALVYSTALRFTSNPHHAEEIAQAVFVILAQKAGTLSSRVILSGWLYQTARLTAANFVKGEIRRAHREQEVYMQSILPDPELADWNKIAPLLDEAMGSLGETDRNALVLRFFENCTSAEIGAALRMNEETARKRVNRALDKLRKIFSAHGVSSTAEAVAGAIAANSLQVVPASVAQSVTAAAVVKGTAVSTSTLTLIKGTLKIMAWSKTQTVIVAGVIVLLAAGTTTATVKHIQTVRLHENLWRYPDINSMSLAKVPPAVDILPTIFPKGGNSASTDRKYVGIDQSVVNIVADAYNWPQARIVFTDGQPPERYDYIASLLNGSREALQDQLKKKLGLVAHPEMRNEDVVLLEMQNPHAPGLHPPVAGTTSDMTMNGNQIELSWQNRSISSMADRLQMASPLPIIDETHSTKHYSIDITWQEDPQDPEHTALQKVLREQLGLIFVPTNMPVKMLVVEKVK
ncbi:MAG TPA: TIGR03435 family protein [Verrucomicrobiae bacterium]|jgi:uncharacterized protein (TIGR03435 family)